MRRGCFIVVLLAVFPFAALAQTDPGSGPTLLAPAGEFRSRSEPIRIQLGDVSPGNADQLHVLVDEVDLTSFTRVENGVATVELPAPLAGGRHELSLVEIAPDGSIPVHGSWDLEVHATSVFESGYVDANVTEQLTYRAAEGDVGRMPDRFQAEGAAQVDVGASSESISLEGSAPFFWNTHDEILEGKHAEVGSWLASVTAGPGRVRAGHQFLEHPTMALDMTERRGVSAQLSWERARSTVTGFSLHGSPIEGFRENVGLGDDDDRISGGQVHVRPFANRFIEAGVTGVFVKGRAPADGSDLSGVVGPQTPMDGTSWSVRGEGSLFEGRVEAVGEYAWSEWDFDKGGDDQHDHAYLADVSVRPVSQVRLGEHVGDWRVYGRHSRIGTYFASLGNPGFPADRKTTDFGTELYLAGLSVSGSAGRRKDNVSGGGSRPRMQADTWEASASFTPADLLGGERKGPLRWIGMPLVEGTYFRERIEPDSEPAIYATLLPDETTWQLFSAITFSYDRWSWSAGHTIIDVDDHTAARQGLHVDRTEIQLDLELSPWIALQPRVQLERTQLQGAPNERSILAALRVDATVVPDRLSAWVAASFQRAYSTDHALDTDVWDVSGEVAWTAVRATRRHPSLTFSALGSYHGVDDDAFPGSNVDAYQVFARATLAWPVSLGER